ncbi:hypothetical protein [Methylomarinovum caldicuralii]|uniref:hypothetical protein n=1 Tax=Methylomarinovum caldicuralii TaxID=438856 RepID=UPI002954D267|nr:hypothetical protein [Methylomarinovum caldicuralii]
MNEESSVSRVIRPHHSKLTALVRLLDNAAIFFSLVFLLEWTGMPVSLPYLWLGLGGSVFFGFFAEALEVYQSWRGSPFSREARRLAFAHPITHIFPLLIGINVLSVFSEGT